MPAPSSMAGRQTLSLNLRSIGSGDIDTGDGNEATGNGRLSARGSLNNRQRTLSEPSTGAASVNLARIYDEVFTSKPVSETKTMLWEIKNFTEVLSKRVERAMNFEFEVGRLGSMERHLPRRSRWKIMLDAEMETSGINPALRVLQLFPENKIMFYRLEACIVDNTGTIPPNFITFQTACNDQYREGLNDVNSTENVFPILTSTPCFSTNHEDSLFLNRIRNYLADGSLFFRVKMEVLEDASTQ